MSHRKLTIMELPKLSFNPKIWTDDFQKEISSSVFTSSPYKWGSITELMDDNLLRTVRKEVLTQISFTKKETDIYKVYQSGDLANLSGLDWEDLSKLPALYKLRSAIYSQEFRDFISSVTNCGPLSGIKTDMSINTYKKGCHLLTHDDVIGTRRVSFILYLPEPNKVWEPKFGGSLRLFPTIVPNVPHPDYSVKLTPQFNQIAFFTVQPGLSFHDVEEVRYDKHRLSIQGWFHIPQPGESGFIHGEKEETESKSSLQQLQSKTLQLYDFPKPLRWKVTPPLNQDFVLNSDEIEFLSTYINPNYLSQAFLTKIQSSFVQDSIIELKDFLKVDVQKRLQTEIRKHELESSVPKKCTEFSSPWKCAIPPHKQRYMYIDGQESFAMTKEAIKVENDDNHKIEPKFEPIGKSPEDLLLGLSKFLKTVQFQKFIKLVTNLIVTSEQVIVRRFRPGLDFILATISPEELGNDEKDMNALLEATLNLTPTAINEESWESGEFGGYEVCMATSEEEEGDPAIYKGGDPNDDSVLYTSQCKWNSLTLMLRDPSVMKFVKYVSINAKGSRWDISAQWNIEDVEDDEDENNEEENQIEKSDQVEVSVKRQKLDI